MILLKLRRQLRDIWWRLIAPSKVIQGGEARQQATLLSGLSLVLLLVAVGVVFSWVFANPDFTAARYISAALLLSLFIIYLISRSDYHQIGAFFFVGLILVAVGAVVLTSPGLMSERMLALNFLIVGVLLSSILLSVRQTVLVTAICLTGIAIFFFIPDAPYEVTYTYLVFMTIMAALLVLSSVMRSNYIRQMRISQRQYRALFNQSNDAVFILDLDGNNMAVNQNATKMLGYSTEEMEEMSFRDMVAPSELEDGQSILDRLLTNEHLPIYERTFRRKDGTEFPAEVNVELVKDTEGVPLHIQSIVRDITERKRTEDALRASEERFRRLTFESPDTIYIYNLAENKVTFFNNDSFLGYSREELQKSGSITSHIHSDDMERVTEFWQALIRGEDIVHAVDFRLQHQAGHWEWVHNRAIVLSSALDNRPNEIFVVLTIITESKKAEELLRQQEAYLRILFEQTPIGIVTVDKNGILTGVNHRSMEILGSTDSTIDSHPNLLMVSNLIEKGISQLLEGALVGGKMAEMETWYTSIWGKSVYLLIRAVPHFDGQGEQIGLIVLVEDLTERIQAEEGMRRMQKLESLSVLAGGIAHDFNNLLVAMLGQTSLAKAKLPAESPGRPHVEKAVLAAERASQLTHQLLAYSGRGHFQVTHLDLNGLIEENLHLFATTIPKYINLRTMLNEGLPLIEVDVAQIQQLVMNLIINAAEAIEDEQGAITIVTDTQYLAENGHEYWQYTMKPLDDGLYVTLDVRDDGQGMSEETLANIFDPFFTTKEKGHGLGLAAVLGIIKGHRGGLTLYSELGKGTTFKILLPTSSLTGTADEAISIDEIVKGNGMVLVIDDEPHVRVAVTDILGLDDIEVITATNGNEGLRVYQERRSEIGLILLDLSMPGWSGEQTMQELRKVDPEVPIILSSGYNEVEATRLFDEKGLVRFLKKPYSAEKLLEMVQQYLGKKKQTE